MNDGGIPTPTERAWSREGNAVWRRATTIVTLASAVVPRARRTEWRAEWLGELYYRILALDRAVVLDPADRSTSEPA